jgi:mannosyltransferase OCH1-like enzyme
VEVRKWDNLEEALTTPLAYTMQRKNLVRNDERNWKGGDLMRIIVLWKHGGVYVDLDTLILRPLTPLLNQDFVYQWSCQRDEANGAVMYATRPRSWMMQQFMDELPRVEVRLSIWAWRRR